MMCVSWPCFFTFLSHTHSDTLALSRSYSLSLQALDSFLKERHFLIIVNTQNSATHIILPSPEEPQQRYFLLLETLKHYACNKVFPFSIPMR